jgi:hypothetical protein
MDSGAGVGRPQWLTQCRTEILASAEWGHVRAELLRRLQEEVTATDCISWPVLPGG